MSMIGIAPMMETPDLDDDERAPAIELTLAGLSADGDDAWHALIAALSVVVIGDVAHYIVWRGFDTADDGSVIVRLGVAPMVVQ